MGMGKNSAGYPDPTAWAAWNNMRREERQQEAERRSVMKQTAELAGFEIVGRIALRDKATGIEYR